MNLEPQIARARVAYSTMRPAAFAATLLAISAGFAGGVPCRADEAPGAAAFRAEVEPVLAEFCFGCHSGAGAKAKLSFDSFASDRELLESRELWWKALKQIRAGFMPPREEPHPSAEQFRQIEE